MIKQPQITTILPAIETFLNDNLGADLPFVDDLELQYSSIDESKIQDSIKIFRQERIIFIDFMYLMMNFPDVNINQLNAKTEFEKMIYSNEATLLIKYLKHFINQMTFVDDLKNGDEKLDFEIRFFNFSNSKRFTEINSRTSNFLVSLKGVVFHRWDEIRQFPSQRIWECRECGNPTSQHMKRGIKYKKKYNNQCLNKIGEGDKAFVCTSVKWNHIEDRNYEDFFRMRIEALPEDTPSKLEYPTFSIEFTHNLCQESFLNEVITGQAYEFTGFIRLDEVKTKKGDIHYKPYMEVMSYRTIEKRRKKLYVSKEEEEQITIFLQEPNSINHLASIFSKRVVGFEREKKYFIISKALHECFNRQKKRVSPKDYVCHILLVGDWATGKSEFAEACEDICDNSYYIIGSSTSSVGLTGITERDEMTGHYSIQAGILARASGDVLIIEEFDKQENKAEFGVINEAMSKYEYTITKAGKSRKFRCHTSLLVVANPKGKKFDKHESLIPQIDIAGDLLSRFTVISCKLEGQDVERQIKIDNVMIDRVQPELIESDKQNAEYIKKCIKVASKVDPNLNTPIVKEFIHNFTRQTFAIKDTVLGDDKKFWENMGNPRNRHSLLKLIKGVAMLHLHDIPTKEDCIEARELFYKFQEDIIQNPELLDPEEISWGITKEEIAEKVKEKTQAQEWSVKLEQKVLSKKGRRELFLEVIDKLQEDHEDKIADLGKLEKRANEELQMSKTEVEELVENMRRNGIIFEPRPGFIKLM